MAVRPFYIDAEIDGRQTSLSGGPRRGDGELSMRYTQRADGGIVAPFRLGTINYDGKLKTIIDLKQPMQVRMPDGEYIELPAGAELIFETRY